MHNLLVILALTTTSPAKEVDITPQDFYAVMGTSLAIEQLCSIELSKDFVEYGAAKSGVTSADILENEKVIIGSVDLTLDSAKRMGVDKFCTKMRKIFDETK